MGEQSLIAGLFEGLNEIVYVVALHTVTSNNSSSITQCLAESQHRDCRVGVITVLSSPGLGFTYPPQYENLGRRDL